MNSRWQDYNSNREKYVQGLHNKIVDLEQRLKSTQNSPQKTQKMEGLLKCASEKLQKETETREKVVLTTSCTFYLFILILIFLFLLLYIFFYPLSYFSFQPVLHDWWYVLSCLWDDAYKRPLAVNR